MSVRVAYLVNHYPKISHSFVRREIHALERQGLSIYRIALRGWMGELADEDDRNERALTRYVLRDSAWALLWSLLSCALQRPRRFLSALLLAIRVSRSAERPLIFHLVYLAEACRILPWVKASGAMHVHAHFGTNSAEIAMLVRVLGGPTYSFTVHGQDELLFGGNEEKVRRAAFVVAISSYGRSQLYRRISFPLWAKVKVVHCGLEATFYGGTPAPPPLAPRLVCVGRLSPEKGHLLLIEAAHKLAKRGVRFELVLAGDGEMRQELEALIARLGITAQVRVTGWISGSQVRNEILAARGLVLASFTEGLPVVIMEAMALRRPVLATYITGIPELVLPGVNGWLFPAGSADDLAGAMEDCLRTSPERLRDMGEAAHQRVIERHSIDVEAGKLAKFFQEACELPGPE